MRAEQRLQQRRGSRKYSSVKVEPVAVDEFDQEEPTRPIPPCTMAQLIATVQS